MHDGSSSLRSLIWIALLAALVAVGAYVQLPIGAVPFSMQPLFVMLAGLILGPARGAACAGLYLAAGLIGLPVYAGGASGLGHLLGPTGGYLFGFVLLAALSGLPTHRRAERPRRLLGWVVGSAACALAMVVQLALGVTWLRWRLELTWWEAFAAGALPFLVGDVFKILIVVAVYRHMERYALLPDTGLEADELPTEV